MKKKEFPKLTIAKIALTGLINGVLLHGHAAGASSPESPQEEVDVNSENLGYHLMSEEELLLELSEDGAKQYEALSPEGKLLASKIASQRCQGSNSCRGENACKSDKNECAGLGTCKGETKCAISDKNLAVRLASQKMEKKRADSLGSAPL